MPRGARARPEALRPARHPLPDLDREEQPRRPGGVPPARLVLLRPDRRGHVRALPTPHVRLERRRLRRHALPHGPAPRELPRGAREVADGVPLHPRRRVPGHEPCAVPVPAAHGRKAQEPFRRGRSGPVHLRLPRRGHPQHHGVRGRLSRDARDPARAELPLDEHDPARREHRDREQPRAQAEGALVGARRGRAGARDRGRGRARRGAVRRGRDRAPRRGGLQRLRGRGLLPDERAVARARGRARAPGDPVPGDRRAEVLRAAPRSRT